MNLAKALKQKNRLTQKITDLQEEIRIENSIIAGNPRKVDVEYLMKELEEAIEDLIKLKITIFIASTPMRENILRLSELKSRIAFLKTIKTKEGKISEYGEEAIEYTAVYDKVWIKEKIKKCEKEIDDIQDELDNFNYHTKIEV